MGNISSLEAKAEQIVVGRERQEREVIADF
jgi:hypothetical protein